MNGLVGAGALVRLILRRERFKLSAWVLVLAVLPVVTASAFAELYPTEAARQGLAITVGANPALTALLGPLQSTSIGGLTFWRMGVIGGVLIAIMAILTVVRHTREEEETGRRELLGSTVMGRHAPLAAVLAVTLGAGVIVGVVQAVGLISLGNETAGSLAFGVAFVGVCMAFAGVAAVAAQLAETSGAAKGIAMTVLGASFLLRVAGDAADLPALSWASPIGWMSGLRPFAGEEWWVFGLWLAFGLALATIAALVAARRDVGAGAFPPRPGPARASDRLSGPTGLSWRLHRGGLAGWSVGVVTVGLVYGGVADGIGDFLTDSPQLAEIFELLGGERGITDAFFIAAVGIIAFIAAAYSIRAVLRIRVEEELLRAEMVLATATPRSRLAASHLLFAMVGPALMLVAAGAVAGAAYGAIVGDIAGEAARVMAAAAVQLPAVWVLTGIAMTLYGVLPRRTGLAWAALIAFLLLGQLGAILQFPQWTMNLSPFAHVPAYPAVDIEWLPIGVLLVVGVGLIGLGVAAFSRRDIPAV
jgi:ABC-2 type transport system permease protein